MDKKKPSYVIRGKNKRRALNSYSQLVNKSQSMKKKGWSQRKNLKNDDSPILLTLEAIPFTRKASPKAC